MVTVDRRTRKRQAARRRVIDAAIDLFGERGLDAVTVDEIARAADVGKGTIYTHFPTKEAIIVAFIAETDRKAQAKLQAFDPANRTPAEALTEFVRLQLRLKKAHHRFVRMFFAQMFLRTETFLPYMAEIHGAMAPTLAALFAGFEARGLVKPGVTVADLVLVFGNLQFGVTAQWAIEGPPFQGTDYVLQRAVAAFCDGMMETPR